MIRGENEKIQAILSENKALKNKLLRIKKLIDVWKKKKSALHRYF